MMGTLMRGPIVVMVVEGTKNEMFVLWSSFGKRYIMVLRANRRKTHFCLPSTNDVRDSWSSRKNLEQRTMPGWRQKLVLWREQ